jgi:hypothetical protein
MNPMSNLATTGGTGSGLTVNVTETGGYASDIAIATAGTGYTNGDLITVTSGTSNATFTIVIGGRNSWRFGIDGNLTLPQTGYLKVGSGIVPAFISSPAPIITGFSNISAQNFTFLANGVNILSTAVGTYSNTNVAAYLTLGVTTANLTATGNITQQSAYYETYGNIVNSGGNLTCNFNLGSTFYAALTANVTANFTNVNAITSTVTGATIIVDQGATAYRVANVQVNGVNQTVRWVGASTGVGTASNTDVMSFSLIHLGGGAWRVLGQISNYG